MHGAHEPRTEHVLLLRRPTIESDGPAGHSDTRRGRTRARGRSTTSRGSGSPRSAAGLPRSVPNRGVWTRARPTAPSDHLKRDQTRRCLRSCAVAIVRAAFSETFEVSAASTRRRVDRVVGIESRSRAVSRTSLHRPCRPRSAAPRRGAGRATSLRSCSSCARTLYRRSRPRARVSSSSPLHRGRGAAVEQRARALFEQLADVRRVAPARLLARAGPPARSARRASAGARLPRRTVAWCCEREVARIESATLTAENERERHAGSRRSFGARARRRA